MWVLAGACQNRPVHRRAPLQQWRAPRAHAWTSAASAAALPANTSDARQSCAAPGHVAVPPPRAGWRARAAAGAPAGPPARA